MLNRKFSASKSPTFHILTVGNNMSRLYKRLFFLIISFSLFTCDKKSVIENELDSLAINPSDFIKTDTTLYESSNVEKLRFIKSKDEYITITFYESGKKKSIIPVKKSQVHGECLTWYENDVLKWKRYYEYGNSIKLSTNYDENGNRIRVDDASDNSFTEFYSNDSPRLKRSNNVLIDYYMNGKTKTSFIKLSDSLTKVEFFSENGETDFKGTSDVNLVLHKNGLLFNGKIESEFSDGKISFIQNFIDGLPDGKSFSKYGNRNTEFEVEFRLGKEIGIRKRYYSNGQIESVKDFSTGESERWDEKGNIKE